MSALPDSLSNLPKVNSYLQNSVENTDCAILSDQEVYELKGGDNIALAKVALGLVSAFAYLRLSGNLSQITKFNLSGKLKFNFKLQHLFGQIVSFFQECF